ncbi:hypothetical protein ACQP1O_21305 [Nocardia sp. CA-151230]|uniref:hypothetical protein n=1 Tax=Nocardia sp. CA-151230 TaxID=3239982 RepID=UPI003D8EC293
MSRSLPSRRLTVVPRVACNDPGDDVKVDARVRQVSCLPGRRPRPAPELLAVSGFADMTVPGRLGRRG